MVTPATLLGRSAENRVIDVLLAAPATGTSAALVVTGPPGVGRTALLEAAAARFPGDVVHLRPDRCDATLPARLAARSPAVPLLVCADDLQRWPTEGVGVLGALAAGIDELPSVALLMATAGPRSPVAGVRPLVVEPLAADVAAAVVAAVSPHDLADDVVAALVTEADGSPALLVRLAAGITASQAAGLAPLPRPLAGDELLIDVVGGPFGGLAPPTPAEIVVAALLLTPGRTQQSASLDEVRRALARLQAPDHVPSTDLLAVEGTRTHLAGRVVARAVLAAAPPDLRRRVCLALADIAFEARDTVAAAWHEAAATPGPAAALADRLAEAASVPHLAHDARWAVLARSAELSDSAPARAGRLVSAAGAAVAAGEPGTARHLLAGSAPEEIPGGLLRGRAELVRGRALMADGLLSDASATLLVAAEHLRDDPELRAAAWGGAADAAWAAGDHAACVAALSRVCASDIEHPAAPYRQGMLALLTGDPAGAAAPLHETVRGASRSQDPDRMLRGTAAALLLGDVPAAGRAGARALAAARALGDDVLMARATELLAYAELRGGHHGQAGEHARLGLRAALRAGHVNIAAHHHAVLALVGSVGGAVTVGTHIEEALDLSRRHGLSQAMTLAEWAAARVALADGRAAEAATRLDALLGSGPGGAHFALRGLLLPTCIEALATAGEAEAARPLLDELRTWVSAGSDPQAAAVLWRCRALLSDDEADVLFERAHAEHRRSPGDHERAHSLLLHGKWLRRRRRPVDARERLRAAQLLFERCGAVPWADVARSELRASGSAADDAPRDRAFGCLTPQQQRIAHRVAAGDTNREIAERLSVSVRTVDHHLRNVFAALDVRSRVELARLVPSDGA